MALTFARALAMLRRAGEPIADELRNPLGGGPGDLAAWRAGKKAVARATSSPIKAPSGDVLAWYGGELGAAGASLATPSDRLVALFGIMLGLGMRESSGRHCVGADTPQSRGEPTTEENAEAGLFQVSYDSIAGDGDRQELFDTFQGRSDLIVSFEQGVHCNIADWANHGNAAGSAFQRTMKQCPLFAALYTAAYLRQRRSHWGPINRRKAEVKTEAIALFDAIGRLAP